MSTQDALFGDPVEVDDPTPARVAVTQDVELVASVVRAATDPGYRLVERSGRVFRVDPTRPGAVETVPRYESETVLQLIDSRLLEVGGNHTITYGRNSGPARSVLVPRQTRDQVARWANLAPIPTPRRSTDHSTDRSTDNRTTGKTGRTNESAQTPGQPSGHGSGRGSVTRWCPECGEPAQAVPPTRWTRADGPRPRSSHLDGTPLCPVVTDRGYRPARITARRPR